MKKMMKKVSVLLLAVLMLTTVFAVPAQAATSVTLKNQSFTTTKATASKKAKTVKKGTYTVKPGSKGSGYLKFTAPSTKTWTFKVSNAKLKAGSSYENGYFYIMKTSPYSSKSITMTPVTTNGGQSSSLYFATRDSLYSTKVGSFLKSRYGKTKLTKGTTVYLYFYTTVKSFTLTIK